MSELTNLFSGIANAIRAKTGNAESIAASGFPEAIANIATGANYSTETVKKWGTGYSKYIPATTTGKENCIFTIAVGSTLGASSALGICIPDIALNILIMGERSSEAKVFNDAITIANTGTINLTANVRNTLGATVYWW